MKVLFLSLGKYWSISEKEGYTDLLRNFINNGHEVFILSPTERREGKKTQLIEEDHSEILKVRTGNIQKTNFIEKGISTILIESQFLYAIKKYYANIQFDLVLYPTPPITFVKVVEYVKKRDGAKTYLLLKDIFPQNAVDIGILSRNGVKGFLYKYFRKKEKKLYKISDIIGCMSQANVDYILKHNPEILPSTVEICPNVIDVSDKSITSDVRNSIRKKYDIPIDKKVFIYGGNLGKPQGIDFMLKCFRSLEKNAEAFFLVIGNGTEYSRIQQYMEKFHPLNVALIQWIPKEYYDNVVAACDVGLIFLDHRFTIPNFPSRLLGYLQAKLPVLACTDVNTDIGKVIVEGDFGWWCESNDVRKFKEKIDDILCSNIESMGNKGYQYLVQNYSAKRGYEIIHKWLDK